MKRQDVVSHKLFVIYTCNQHTDNIHWLRNPWATPKSGEAVEQQKILPTAGIMCNHFGIQMNIYIAYETETALRGDTQKKWMHICNKIHVYTYS